MNLRRIFLILVMFGFWSPAYGQNTNLLKNPSGEDGSEHWRAFKDAKVEPCPTGGQCFVLRAGGYFIQDVVVPEDAVGHYALLTGRAYTDGTDSNDGGPTYLPSLHGYMMNSGDPSGGRIYGYLSGQQMTASADSYDKWTQLWGIFRVKPGTGRIRLFLRHGMKDGGHDGAPVRFDDLGVYIFPTEAQARALVGQWPVGAQSTDAAGEGAYCQFSREVPISLYGVKLGMSLEQVLSFFPAAAGDANVWRAFELSRSPDFTSPIMLSIAAGKAINQNLADVKQFFFKFRNGRLFSVYVDYLSPKWKDVNEFIEQRGYVLNLPPANTWEPVTGNQRSSKYLICDGIEVRFYAAPARSLNNNYISITDTSIEGVPVKPPKLEQARKP